MPDTGTNKLALITGASTGLGEAFARVAADDGYNLLLTARNNDELQRLARELHATYGVEATAVACDLTDRASRDVLTDAIEASPPDVLVNNAGMGASGAFATNSLQQELAMTELNCAALVELTKHCLPPMLQRQRGRIINVASMAAFQPGPFQAVYYASKAFVLSFSEAVAEEVADSPVVVSTFCPGPLATNFHERAGASAKTSYRQKMMMEPIEAARIAWDAAATGRRIVIPGFKNKAVAFAVKLLPRSVVTKLAGRIQEKRN